jgi:hypothetical protein
MIGHSMDTKHNRAIRLIDERFIGCFNPIDGESGNSNGRLFSGSMGSIMVSRHPIQWRQCPTLPLVE